MNTSRTKPRLLSERSASSTWMLRTCGGRSAGRRGEVATSERAAETRGARARGSAASHLQNVVRLQRRVLLAGDNTLLEEVLRGGAEAARARGKEQR